MDMESLILIANPGSASRKYALYQGSTSRADIHFEFEDSRIVCTVETGDEHDSFATDLTELAAASGQVVKILRDKHILLENEAIETIGLRFVAPGSYFTQDHIVDDDFVARMEATLTRAPLHINATLIELRALRRQFPDTTIVGVSDSAFHTTKPAHAVNYGLPLEDTDKFEIKRYGYHGLSYMSVVHILASADKLPAKLVVAHLGSGASVSAIQDGKSIDNTMGYSPLEGLIMSTRSGTIDATVASVLRNVLNLDDSGLENYLNKKSGLLGLGGSDDIRELLSREAAGDARAILALDTYVYSVQKAIAHMTVALDGIDALVFTGTVGLRSAPMRSRIMDRLHHLGISLNEHLNETCDANASVTSIQASDSKPVLVISVDEHHSIVARVVRALKV